MTNYESIYTNHYEGETYRFGVAYLREEEQGYDPDSYPEEYPSLKRQRRIIEQLAQKAQTLVIAEFIDHCGPLPAEQRDGLSELLDFWHDTHPQMMFAATGEVLAFDTNDNFFVAADLNSDRPEVITRGWSDGGGTNDDY